MLLVACTFVQRSLRALAAAGNVVMAPNKAADVASYAADRSSAHVVLCLCKRYSEQSTVNPHPHPPPPHSDAACQCSAG